MLRKIPSTNICNAFFYIDDENDDDDDRQYSCYPHHIPHYLLHIKLCKTCELTWTAHVITFRVFSNDLILSPF